MADDNRRIIIMSSVNKIVYYSACLWLMSRFAGQIEKCHAIGGPFYPVDYSKYRDSMLGKTNYKTQECIRCNSTATMCCQTITMLKFYRRCLCGVVEVTKSNLVNIYMLLDRQIQKKITDPLKAILKEDRKPVCGFYDPFYKVKACFHVSGGKFSAKKFSADVKLTVDILNYQFANVSFRRVSLPAPNYT